MELGAEEVAQRLRAVAGKRAVLAALKDSLDAWERDVDWTALPEDKREALMKLARESAATLKEMIRKVSADIAAARDAGTPGAPGTPRTPGLPGGRNG